jgi:hypothetical protein
MVLMLVVCMSVAQAAIVSVTCANVSTDAATLNNAINGSGTGDWIQIHGTCSLTATVVLKGDRTYTGDSRMDTTLGQANGYNLAAVVAADSWSSNSAYTGNPITLAHLTIDGNKANNSNSICLVVRSWASTVEDVHIANCPGDGLRYSNPSANNTALSNNSVNNTFRNLFIENAGGTGFHVVDTGNKLTDCNLESSWIAGSGQSSIYLDNAAGWRISGNHTYGTPQHAIYLNQCFGTTVSDNYIEDFGDAGISGTTYYGIGVTLQGVVTSVTITGNKVNMFPTLPAAGNYVYIGIIQGNYGTPSAVVSGNLIYGQANARETGLSYQKGSVTAVNVLSSNNVQNVGTARTVGSGVTIVSPL